LSPTGGTSARLDKALTKCSTIAQGPPSYSSLQLPGVAVPVSYSHRKMMLFSVTPVTGLSQNAVFALEQLNCPKANIENPKSARLKGSILEVDAIGRPKSGQSCSRGSDDFIVSMTPRLAYHARLDCAEKWTIRCGQGSILTETLSTARDPHSMRHKPTSPRIRPLCTAKTSNRSWRRKLLGVLQNATELQLSSS
jgi:hypothetical protein